MNLNFLSGYKTLIGGIGLIASGVGMILSAITWEPFQVNGEKITEGVGIIGLGFAAFGLGHKTEKGPVK